MLTNIERRWKMEVTKRWNRFLVIFFWKTAVFPSILAGIKKSSIIYSHPIYYIATYQPLFRIENHCPCTFNSGPDLEFVKCFTRFTRLPEPLLQDCKIARKLFTQHSRNWPRSLNRYNLTPLELCLWTIQTLWLHLQLLSYFFLSGLLFRCILPEIKVDLTRSGKLDSSNE